MPVQSSWNAFSAFQVFGDHVPMEGFSLVLRISAEPEAVDQLISARAQAQAHLDPQLATMMMRAGLGLLRVPVVSFLYVNPVETVAVLRRGTCQELGQSLVVHDHLISVWAARMTMISGIVLPVSGQVFELPDLGVVRTAVRGAVDSFEEATHGRSAGRLGAQLRGRGQPFHTSMIESLEEQSALLSEHGVDIDRLPGWWWRGIAGRSQHPSGAQQIELWTELPATDQLVALIE